MASHLSADQIAQVVSLIDTWPEGTALTWEALRGLVESRLYLRPSRQTLHRQDRIRLAYRSRKDALRAGADGPRRFPNARLNRLDAENARLERELGAAHERLARWQYNAYKHGLTQQQLDAPMPRVDRAQAG